MDYVWSWLGAAQWDSGGQDVALDQVGAAVGKKMPLPGLAFFLTGFWVGVCT